MSATNAGVDWPTIKAELEGGATYSELEAKHDVNRASIYAMARRHGWVSPRARTSVIVMDGRSYRIVKGKRGVSLPASTRSEVLRLIGAGVSPPIAAEAAGVSRTTMDEWKREPEFGALFRAARAQFLGSRETGIAQAGDRGDWRANERLLQVAPETRNNWAPPGKVGGVSGGVTVVFNFGRDAPAATLEGTTAQVIEGSEVDPNDIKGLDGDLP